MFGLDIILEFTEFLIFMQGVQSKGNFDVTSITVPLDVNSLETTNVINLNSVASQHISTLLYSTHIRKEIIGVSIFYQLLNASFCVRM